MNGTKIMQLLSTRLTSLVYHYLHFIKMQYEHQRRQSNPYHELIFRFDRFAVIVTAFSYSVLLFVEMYLVNPGKHTFTTAFYPFIPIFLALLGLPLTRKLTSYRVLSYTYSAFFIILFLLVHYVPLIIHLNLRFRPPEADYLIFLSLIFSQALRPGPFPGIWVIFFVLIAQMVDSTPYLYNQDQAFQLLFMIWTGVIALFIESMLYITIIGYTELRNQRTRANDEMQLAQKVYSSLFPAFSENEHLKLFSRKFTANLTGGDFYDIVQLREGNLGFFLTDVSGHGVSSAMMSAAMKGIIYRIPYRYRYQPQIFMGFIDEVMQKEYGSHHASAVYLFFDFQKKEAHLTNAGHPPVLFSREGSTFAEIETEGAILGYGLMHPIAHEVSFKLKKGDRFLIYTDGLFEYEDEEGNIDGPSDPGAFFDGLEHLSGDEFLDSALDKIKNLPNFYKFRDDVMLVMLEFTGGGRRVISRRKTQKKSARALPRS